MLGWERTQVVVRAAGQRQQRGARTRGVPRRAPYVHVLPRSRRQTLAPASVRSAPSPQPCRAAARRGDMEGEGLSFARSRRSRHSSPPRPAEWAETTTTPSSSGGWPPSREDAERRSSGVYASASSTSESTVSFSEEVRDGERVTHTSRQRMKQPGNHNSARGGQFSSNSKLEQIRRRRAERVGEEVTVEAMMEEALLSSWGSLDELEGWQASRELKAAVQGAQGRGPGLLREAVRQVAASTPLEPASVAKVMMELAKQRSFAAVGEVFEGALVGGVEPTLYMYGVLINALGKQRRLKEAQAAHAEMEASGMAGNVVTFTALIDACTRCGSWQEALKVYYRMQRKGVAPNARTYNSLITGCEHDGQWQVAMEVFKWMKAAGLQPDTFTYSSLISVCEKSGQWEKALDIFGWMSMAKVKANVVTYGSLIAACEKGGQWELALEVFQEMHNSGVQANASTFNTLICACEKGGQWRQALEVGTWMDNADPPVEKDVVTYTALISACNKGRQWERALAVNQEMQRRGVRENEVTYSTLVEAAGNAGQVEAAIEVFERAMAAGFMQFYTPLGAPLPQDSERYDTIYGVDLHGCSEAICRICMLSWLRQLKRGQPMVMQLGQPYMEIITGWGKNSKVLGVSKVRNAVSRMLADGLGEPLRFIAPEDNSGLFRVRCDDLTDWLALHERPEDITLRKNMPYERV